MARAKKETEAVANKELSQDSEQRDSVKDNEAVKDGLVEITLFKTVQISPGHNPMKTGIRHLKPELAEELILLGLAEKI